MLPLAGKIMIDVFNMTTNMSDKGQIMRHSHTCGVSSCHHCHFPLPNLPYNASQPDGMFGGGNADLGSDCRDFFYDHARYEVKQELADVGGKQQAVTEKLTAHGLVHMVVMVLHLQMKQVK